MKVIITILSLFFIQNSYTQQFDTLYLKDNKEIPCIIGRVSEKNIRYLPIGGDQYVKIAKSEVIDYNISDNFFVMDADKKFIAEKVLNFNGFSQKEIYRAFQDWVMLNQRYFLSNGINYTNDEFSIIVGTLFTKEFLNLDLFTLLTAVNNSLDDNEVKPEDINYYFVRYEIVLRAKNGKAKVYIHNLTVESSLDNTYSRPFEELFMRRITRKGYTTNNLTVIREVKQIIKDQLSSIEQHVYNVREYDTWENNLIRTLILDDNW